MATFFSAEPQPSEARDVARILLDTLYDLRDIRSVIRDKNDEVAVILQRTEGALRAKAQQLTAVLARQETLRSREDRAPSAPSAAATLSLTATLPPGAGKSRPKGSVHDQAIWSRLLMHPLLPEAREYLHARYGVPLPSTAEPRVVEIDWRAQRAVLKSAVHYKPATILPPELRENPNAALPPVTDEEVEARGVYNLLRQGQLRRGDAYGALLGITTATPAEMSAFGLTGALQTVAPQTAEAPFFRTVVLPILPRGYAPPSRGAAAPGPGSTWGYDVDRLAEALRSREAATGRRIGWRGIDGDGGDIGGWEGDENPRGFTRDEPEAAEPKTFEVLIRRGQVLDELAEFKQFRLHYKPSWAVVRPVLKRLAALCQVAGVPLAVVEGTQLADLVIKSSQDGTKVTVDMLIECLRNRDQVLELLKKGHGKEPEPPPSEPEPSTAPASARSSAKAPSARVMLSRPRTSEERVVKYSDDPDTREAMARVIQGFWVGFRLRRIVREQAQQRLRSTKHAFTALQAQLHRTWGELTSSPHVVVHCPSYSADPDSRLFTPQLGLRQNEQMAGRLAELSAGPADADVLYVAPFRLPDHLVGYQHTLLQLAEAPGLDGRYRIIWPDPSRPLPPHVGLTQRLLCSRYTLNRTDAFIRGRPGYIVAAHIGPEERDLAVRLGLPLLGPTPEVFAIFNRKSTARVLFSMSGAKIAPGHIFVAEAMRDNKIFEMFGSADPDVTSVGRPFAVKRTTRGRRGGRGRKVSIVVDEESGGAGGGGGSRPGTSGSAGAGGGDDDGGEEEEDAADPGWFDLRTTLDPAAVLARAIIRRQDIARWLFKIDGEDDGRGVAYVDISLFYDAAEALTQLPDNAAEEDRQRVMEILHDVISAELPLGVNICAPSRWPTWEAFSEALLLRGGVLEACLPGVVGSPTVCGFIPPGKTPVQVLSTHEQIFCSPFRLAGVSFPQQSVPNAELVQVAKEIFKTARLMKVCGHVSVDFAAVADSDSESGFHLVAVDFNPSLTNAQSAFKFVEAVTHGGFDPETGEFLCPVGSHALAYEAGNAHVPKMKHPPKQGVASGFQAYRMHALGWQPRAFTAVFNVAHPGLKSIGHFDFFKSCRHAGVNYDVSQQAGTVITLPDSLAGGSVAIISVHHDYVRAFKGLQQALLCVKQQALQGYLKQREDDFLTEESTIDVISSTVHFLCMRLAAAAKQSGGGGGAGAGFGTGPPASAASAQGTATVSTVNSAAAADQLQHQQAAARAQGRASAYAAATAAGSASFAARSSVVAPPGDGATTARLSVVAGGAVEPPGPMGSSRRGSVASVASTGAAEGAAG